MSRIAPVLLTLALALTAAPRAKAQSTEERFHDLFVTAGYCTAFGAAIGTAFLAWTEDPSDNLRYVAMGASLGFLGGSILGTYIIFTPGFADTDSGTSGGTLALDAPLPDEGLIVRPTFDRDTHRLASIEGGMTLLRF